MLNLDQLAAQTAQRIVNESGNPKELDTLATKTLGVLQENGVYACSLFLASRSGKEEKIAGIIRRQLKDALATQEFNLQPPSTDDKQALLDFLASKIAGNLDTLLLVKALWEQILIYVRYGAKAKDAGQKKEG